jgi:acyl carrier protein
MSTIEDVKAVLDENLALGGRARSFTATTELFGTLAELDSFAVVGLVAALEQRFGIQIADDDINLESFASVGALSALVERKLAR